MRGRVDCSGGIYYPDRRNTAARTTLVTRRRRTRHAQVPLIHHIIRKYYACFNERRFAEAAELLARDVEVDCPGSGSSHGRDAYVQQAKLWVRAFPDLTHVVLDIEDRGDTISEVRLSASGTHRGVLDLGVLGTFAPQGARVTFEQRDLFEVRVARITFVRMTLNIAELLAQLTPDRARLM